MSYEYLRRELNAQKETEKDNTLFFIKNGFFESWNPEHRTDPDRGIRNYSTAARWNHYNAGQITREKAIEFASKRYLKQLAKKYNDRFNKLEKVAAAPDLNYINIFVSWTRSRMWGWNPQVEIQDNRFFTSHGSASGCGYDKQSAAVAEALNKNPAALKILYDLKESELKKGGSDQSKTACTGRDNRYIIGYGAGYDVLPYYEGGVGVECYFSILKKAGFETSSHSTKKSDTYIIKKEV